MPVSVQQSNKIVDDDVSSEESQNSPPSARRSQRLCKKDTNKNLKQLDISKMLLKKRSRSPETELTTYEKRPKLNDIVEESEDVEDHESPKNAKNTSQSSMEVDDKPSTIDEEVFNTAKNDENGSTSDESNVKLPIIKETNDDEKEFSDSNGGNNSMEDMTGDESVEDFASNKETSNQTIKPELETGNNDNPKSPTNITTKETSITKPGTNITNNTSEDDSDSTSDDSTLMKNNNNNNAISTDQKKENVIKNERCNICRQFLNNSDIILYEGHPQNSVEEFVALTNEKLVLESGDEGDITERPQTNITAFSIYDTEGHLVPIDSGLVENDLFIYVSGYLKSICTDSPDIDDDCVPVKDVGPIIEWYIHGFDGGVNNCITISTEFGEYNLMKPSRQYTPLMNNLYEKIRLSKVVIEYLEEFHYLLPTYEDLIEIVREGTIPELDDMRMTEEMLHKHAQFICDQVVSLEVDEDDDNPLITLPCIRELMKLIGIRFGKKRSRTKIDFKKVDKKAWTKATTTPLVRKTFESFFSNQLDKTDNDLVLRRKRCGVCEACQLPDCGECNHCRAMAKFGGHGKTKQACVRRKCPNMAVEQANDSEPDDDDECKTTDKKEGDYIDEVIPVKLTGAGSKGITWIGDCVKADATRVYYEKVNIDGMELSNGDYVMVETSQPNIPSLIVKIVYMWKETINTKLGYFHGEVFIRSSDTVLGEVSDPREIFLGDRCCHKAPLSSVLRKATVEKKEIPSDWFRLGGKEANNELHEDDGKTYFYSKYYERLTARFEDLPTDPECPNVLRKHRYCPSCERKQRRESSYIPKVIDKIEEKTEGQWTEWKAVRWQNRDYKSGGAVFLKPGTFKFTHNSIVYEDKMKLDKVDENIYTEYYRKSDNYMRGSNTDTGEPFCVGYIDCIKAKGQGPLIVPQDIYLKVNVLYRPENTASRFPHHEDLNVVYWSDEIRQVPFSNVVGPCHLFYEKNIPEPETKHEWLDRDPSRLYFREAFDKKNGKLVAVPKYAENVGRSDSVIAKDKGKGKGKGKSSKPSVPENVNDFEEKPVRPLRTLDVFAGCGGLSDGLHQAGIAECRWAIENLEAAAHAYSINNRGCVVFREDCNDLLREVMAGSTHSKSGQRLPTQGEVELLCGGPPCQGFSGMNRFNSREYSNFKNSLVASYLSYCDYYRPKYFILENVRNFVAFKKGMVLKLTLRTLLEMGYQCTFGVVQAGNYGVPQTRRRLIIVAAAPGYKLPLYPEPTHVFSRRACSLTVTIDGKRFRSNIRWTESAPRRTCTIQDAMSDLPTIPNGANKIEIEYGSMPETHFQRMIRSKDENAKLRDHICKNMAPLIQARIARIPVQPGSDWRDLPNISVTLSDGTKCKVLQYRHHDKKNGRSSTGALRGVCACASGKACDPSDKQENTLIPWCLPHTGNRHNHWAGLYGRVMWEGYFSTTVTDPEPMGKQGRVLHPEQHRVVSVRECARSQGFRDTYQFAGSVQDKHRQIGNAVPPPLGAALGREIKRALAARI